MNDLLLSRGAFPLSLFPRWLSLAALSLGFCAVPIHSGSAQVLLTINDSNPAAVVLTATGAHAGVNDNSNTANEGVDLLQFFTLDQVNMTFGQDLTGTLTGGNIGVNYDDVFSDNQSSAGGAFLDMELYVDLNSPGQGNTETFSTTQPAFSGTWTIDLASLGVTSQALPAAGTEGNIISGYSGNPGAVIGQWQVEAVPEPGTISLAVAGFAVAAMASFCQRRKAGKTD